MSKQHVGTKVIIPGEKYPATVVEYRGTNSHGSHMYLVQLKSGATRLYSGQRLYSQGAGKAAPLHQTAA